MLWEGHSSVIDELAEDARLCMSPPSHIIASVIPSSRKTTAILARTHTCTHPELISTTKSAAKCVEVAPHPACVRSAAAVSCAACSRGCTATPGAAAGVAQPAGKAARCMSWLRRQRARRASRARGTTVIRSQTTPSASPPSPPSPRHWVRFR